MDTIRLLHRTVSVSSDGRQFTEQYKELRTASIAFSSFPFTLNEQSPDFYTSSVKSCILMGFVVAFMLALVLVRAWIVVRYGEPFRLWTIRTLSCFSICVCFVLGLAYYWLLLGYSLSFSNWERRMKESGRLLDGGIGNLDPGDDSLGIPASIGEVR